MRILKTKLLLWAFLTASTTGAQTLLVVNQGDSTIGRWFRDSFFQPLQLNSGTGEAFDAVQSGGMNEGAFGSGGTEPANIDCQVTWGQIIPRGTFCVEQDRFNLPAASEDRRSEPGSGGEIIRREKIDHDGALT